MGHKGSKPEKPREDSKPSEPSRHNEPSTPYQGGTVACDTTIVPFYFHQECEAVPSNHFHFYPGSHSPGTTSIRIFVGSHESSAPMNGDMPEIALFDTFGRRIAEYDEDVLEAHTPEGGFKDLVLKHEPGWESHRPAYMELRSGTFSICISAISFTFPDETKLIFSGDELSICPFEHIFTQQSRTYVGTKGDQPKCFWLHGWANAAEGPGVYRASFHLPDLAYSPARGRAYAANPELFCRNTPRFHTWTADQEHWKFTDWRIPIWNPPMEYDPKTKFDKDPSRQLNWVYDERYDQSDYAWENRPSYRFARRVKGRTPGAGAPYHYYNSTSMSNSTRFSNSTSPSPLPSGPLRTAAPSLIVSTKLISAESQCQAGTFNNTDYVSLSEQIYCDMQSRSMYYVCNDKVSVGCWDSEVHGLRGWEARGAPVMSGVGVGSLVGGGMEGTWSASGPMFGFVYQNVSLVG